MQNSKNIVFLVVLFFALPCLSSAEVAKQAVNSNVVTPGNPAANSANMESIMIASTIVNAYPIAKDIYQTFFPTEEQKANATLGSERLAFVQARASFRKCLFSNKFNSQRGFLNAPLSCQQLLETFVECGGTSEAVIIIRDFDTLRK